MPVASDCKLGGEANEPGAVIEPAALLARKQPLIVRGPAGAGKTTWLRWTFRRLLDADEHPDAVPLFIELRVLARIWDHICSQASRTGECSCSSLPVRHGM